MKLYIIVTEFISHRSFSIILSALMTGILIFIPSYFAEYALLSILNFYLLNQIFKTKVFELYNSKIKMFLIIEPIEVRNKFKKFIYQLWFAILCIMINVTFFVSELNNEGLHTIKLIYVFIVGIIDFDILLFIRYKKFKKYLK